MGIGALLSVIWNKPEVDKQAEHRLTLSRGGAAEVTAQGTFIYFPAQNSSLELARDRSEATQ